ncbi:hypothetical protein E4U54_000674 [Claviceps lovelessii]|nr:hypothetical protein E4U54_000674 [Claviceps lovelessii]
MSEETSVWVWFKRAVGIDKRATRPLTYRPVVNGSRMWEARRGERGKSKEQEQEQARAGARVQVQVQVHVNVNGEKASSYMDGPACAQLDWTLLDCTSGPLDWVTLTCPKPLGSWVWDGASGSGTSAALTGQGPVETSSLCSVLW